MKYIYFFLLFCIISSFFLLSSEKNLLKRPFDDNESEQPRSRCLWCDMTYLESCQHNRQVCKNNKLAILKDAESAGITFRRIYNKDKRR